MLQSDPDTVLAVVGGWFKRDSDDKWEGKL